MAVPPDSPNRTEWLSGETIHDLRAPLTVIKAQAQMLERWVKRNEIDEPERVLARLAVINTMIAKLVLQLDVLRQEGTHDEGVIGPDPS